MRNLADNVVPDGWGVFYFSLKSLSNWIADLNDRMEFFGKWIQ